jgi:sirohydrochlorin cobaltochelatase
MKHFAELRRADSGLPQVEVAFVAVAAPSLSTVLELASASRFRRIVVQPHLLFSGDVLAEIEQLVAARRLVDAIGQRLQRDWVVARPLGPSEQLVAAIMDIASKLPDWHS